MLMPEQTNHQPVRHSSRVHGRMPEQQGCLLSVTSTFRTCQARCGVLPIVLWCFALPLHWVSRFYSALGRVNSARLSRTTLRSRSLPLSISCAVKLRSGRSAPAWLKSVSTTICGIVKASSGPPSMARNYASRSLIKAVIVRLIYAI
jgi:hypothetical protein